MDLYFILRKKTIITALLFIPALVLVMLLGAGLTSGNVVETAASDNNWGLSFNTSDGIPRGNASNDELQKYDALYLGDTSQKTIYLTFDAGYENGYTAQILDTLKKHNVKATFFLVGNFISSSPELVKRMVDEGHTVGNHTMTHPDMASISDKESFSKELTELEELYKGATGQDMKKLYRPPQGKFSTDNLKMAKSMGYHTVFWSLAYVDWYNEAQPTREEAFDKLIPRIHNGAVVLLHSTSETNCNILDELLTKWEEMGYTFGDIKDLTGV